MKKTVILLLAVLLVAMLAVPASAAGAASLVVSSATVYRGNTFTMTVYVSNLEACRTGGIEVTHGDGLELVSGEWLMSGAALANFSASSKDGVFALDTAKKLSGNIFRMTFKVKSNAAFTGNKVSVKLLINNAQVQLEKPLTITVACKHNFGAWASAGASGHSHTCSVCGKKSPASMFMTMTAIQAVTCAALPEQPPMCSLRSGPAMKPTTSTPAKTAVRPRIRRPILPALRQGSTQTRPVRFAIT